MKLLVECLFLSVSVLIFRSVLVLSSYLFCPCVCVGVPLALLDYQANFIVFHYFLHLHIEFVSKLKWFCLNEFFKHIYLRWDRILHKWGVTCDWVLDFYSIWYRE